MHPAYTDLFCDRHEYWHQSDICPRCEIEDEDPTPIGECLLHGEFQDGACEQCDEIEYDRVSQNALSQDGAR
jgi:hypothetical protein